MQEFWGTFEFLALAILFVLQIYFLALALNKMSLMSGFFPDIKSIHIKRVAIDVDGKEVKEQPENKSTQDSNHSSFLHEESTRINFEDNNPIKPYTPSVEDMKKMKLEELRPYIKYLCRAYWSRTAGGYCMRPDLIVDSKDSIVAIKPSNNEYSTFGPSKTFTVEEFQSIMKLPNVYASYLYEVIKTDTGFQPSEIKVLTPGKCVEDGTKWKIINKCSISI